MALDRKNLVPLECKESRNSSIIFIFSCMMKWNYILQQWEQAYYKKKYPAECILFSCFSPAVQEETSCGLDGFSPFHGKDFELLDKGPFTWFCMIILGVRCTECRAKPTGLFYVFEEITNIWDQRYTCYLPEFFMCSFLFHCFIMQAGM